MRISEAATLLDYLYWARDRVLRAAAELDAGAFTTGETVTTRDLRATLVHELDVQWSWRERLRGAPVGDWGPDAELKADDYPTLEVLMDHWRRDEAEMRAWLSSLSDGDLDTPPAGEEGRLALWHYLIHIVSHGIQQLSDAAVLLTRAGHSPGEIGFLEFIEDARQPSSGKR